MSTATNRLNNSSVHGARSGTFSVKSVVHTKGVTTNRSIKYRTPAVNADALKSELLEKELQNSLAQQQEKVRLGLVSGVVVKEEVVASEVDLSKFDDSDEELKAGSDDDAANSDSGSDSDSDSDSEDEDELLMRELAKVRAEKEAEKVRVAQEAHADAQAREQADALLNNPILRSELEGSGAVKTTVKRRWDEDVVFRNQSRDEHQVKKRYINDTVRSDFHLAFLKKYMK